MGRGRGAIRGICAWPTSEMSCPGCARPDSQLLWEVGDRLFGTTARRFEIRRCAACALLFLWPPPAPEELPGFYPEGYWVGPSDRRGLGGLRSRLMEAYRKLVLVDQVRFVRRTVADQRRRGTWLRLADVGCGDGSFLEACGARPCLGLDWSPRAVRSARARGIPAIVGRLEAVPLRAGSLSVLTMFHVLEHVSPAGSCLEAARRLLAPDGRLVVQVPNVDSWQSRFLRDRWAGYDPPRHLIDYSVTTLRATLERHGFEILRATHFSMRDSPTTLANSLAPRLYPPARLARMGPTGGWHEWLANLGYLGLVFLVLPFTLIESGLGRGAAVMVEARPRHG